MYLPRAEMTMCRKLKILTKLTRCSAITPNSSDTRVGDFRSPDHPITRSSDFFHLLACLLLLGVSVQATPHLLNIKLSVANPSVEARWAVPIVVPISELRKIAPNLHAGSLVVTVTHTQSLQQDAAAVQAKEIPSQVDDLENNGKANELVFQLDLQPHETCIVTISYGDPGLIFKIRGDYPAQTDAMFARKIEGLGWESGKNAWRLYFDPRN